MTEKYQPIPHRLKNMAVGGHVAGAEDIDAGDGKTQQEVNVELYNLIKNLPMSDGEDIEEGEAYIDSTDGTVKVKLTQETEETEE